MLIYKFAYNDVESKIKELENKYNITLPESYRLFLNKYNGGNTPKTKYNGKNFTADIRGFYGFGSFEFSFDKVDLSNWVSNDYLPFAVDSFGNTFIISIKEKTCGYIYFLDHEQKDKITFICNDFMTFIEESISEEIPTPRTVEQREAELISKGRGHIINDELRKLWQDEINKYSNREQELVTLK